MLTGSQELVPRAFFIPHNAFHCGTPIHTKLYHLRNQSISRRSGTEKILGKTCTKVINQQNMN